MLDYYIKDKMCLREFVRLARMRAAKIILISGAIGVGLKAASLGVDAYYQKPYDIVDLETACCSMVGLTA